MTGDEQRVDGAVRLARAGEAATDGVTTVVVSLIAEATGRTPEELDPLNDVVDTDALNRIFGERSDGRPRLGGVLVFRSNGCEVTVDGDGAVAVRTLD